MIILITVQLNDKVFNQNHRRILLLKRIFGGISNLAVKVFLNRSGNIRSGWKIVIFLEFIVIFARTSAGKLFSFLPFDIDTMLVTLVISLVMIRFFDRKPMRTLGVFFEKHWNTDFLYGILLGGFVNLLIFMSLWSLKLITWEFNTNFQISGFMAGILLYTFGSTFQELLFRGYLFLQLVEGTGKIKALLITSVIFALYHSTAGIIGWINLGLLGIILGVSVLRSGTLWFAIGMHIGWNIFEGSIFSMLVSGGSNYGSLLNTQLQGSSLLTGGRFGPEASVLEIPVLIVLVIWSFRTKLFAVRKQNISVSEQPGRLKPAKGIALALLACVGPVYYCAAHLPTTTYLPPESQIRLPILLYQAPDETAQVNQVRSLLLKELHEGPDNTIKAQVAIDTTRYDHIAFHVSSISHAYVKRQVINNEFIKQVVSPINQIDVPLELSALRKNSVIKLRIIALSPDSTENLLLLDRQFELKKYIEIDMK